MILKSFLMSTWWRSPPAKHFYAVLSYVDVILMANITVNMCSLGVLMTKHVHWEIYLEINYHYLFLGRVCIIIFLVFCIFASFYCYISRGIVHSWQPLRESLTVFAVCKVYVMPSGFPILFVNIANINDISGRTV